MLILISYNNNMKNVITAFKEHKNYKVNSVFLMEPELKNQMFLKEGQILYPDSEFVKTVGLAELKKKSYILAKITVKSTVFGVILLAKKEPKPKE